MLSGIQNSGSAKIVKTQAVRYKICWAPLALSGLLRAKRALLDSKSQNWSFILKTHIRSRAFDTLFLDAPKCNKFLKNEWKNIKRTICTQNTNKHKLNVFTQKFGLFNKITNKKSISATKSKYKNNYNLNLSNSPWLKLCLSSNKSKHLKELKVINQRIMHQQVLKNGKQMLWLK